MGAKKKKKKKKAKKKKKRKKKKAKKAGKGIFKPVTVSSALARVTGISGKTTAAMCSRRSGSTSRRRASTRPHRRQDRGHLGRRLDVQDGGRGEQAHQVSGCVFFPVNSSRGNAGR